MENPSDFVLEKEIRNRLLPKTTEPIGKAVIELNNRSSLLEDFIHLHYGEKFKAFAKSREYLMKNGVGQKDKCSVGKSLDKSMELVEILKMVKYRMNELKPIRESHPQEISPGPSAAKKAKLDTSVANDLEEGECSGDSTQETTSTIPEPKNFRICPYCYFIISKKLLQEHLLCIHKYYRLLCPVEGCEELRFSSKLKLKSHLRKFHQSTFGKYPSITRDYTKFKKGWEDWLVQIYAESQIPTGEQMVTYIKEVEDYKVYKVRIHQLATGAIDAAREDP